MPTNTHVKRPLSYIFTLLQQIQLMSFKTVCLMLLTPLTVLANTDQTTTANQTPSIYMIAFIICIAIIVIIFGAIIGSTIAYRKSKKTKDNFHKTTKAELAWTLIPMITLIGIAFSATKVMRDLEKETTQALIKPSVTEDTTKVSEMTKPTITKTKEELLSDGQQVYNARCANCHGSTGAGIPGAFPAITGSKVVNDSDTTKHIDILLNGVSGSAMQAFGKQLTDEELAAVMTYQRNSLGNNEGTIIQASDIKAAR